MARLIALLFLCAVINQSVCSESDTCSGTAALKEVSDLEKEVNTLESRLQLCQSTRIALEKELDSQHEKLTSNDFIPRAQLTEANKDRELIKSELDLAQKEISILEERFQVCETGLKATQSRENTCRSDLTLATAELQAAERRVSSAESALIENDCASVKKELRTCNEWTDQLKHDNEALAKKLSDLEASSKEVATLQKKLTAAEHVKSQAETAARHAEAESKAMKQTLDKLLATLESKEQYELLKRQHESEVLPHWLSQRLRLAVDVTSLAAQKTFNSAHSSYKAMTGALSPYFNSFKATGSKLWKLRVSPALSALEASLERHLGESWPALKAGVAGVVHLITKETHLVYSTAIKQGAAVHQALERGVLTQLKKVEKLRHIATPVFVHYALLLIEAAITLPLLAAFALGVIRWIVYRYRTGTASVRQPSIGADFNTIEEKLGYHFSQDAILKQLFTATHSQSLAWLGNKVLQVLAAEGLWKEGHESPAVATAVDGQKVVDAALPDAVLTTAAGKAGLAAWIDAGPGLKSKATAEKKAGDMYAAAVAAVYVDSGFDIAAARKMVKATTR